jgi:uncharacterized protein (DUF486 family)
MYAPDSILGHWNKNADARKRNIPAKMVITLVIFFIFEILPLKQSLSYVLRQHYTLISVSCH